MTDRTGLPAIGEEVDAPATSPALPAIGEEVDAPAAAAAPAAGLSKVEEAAPTTPRSFEAEGQVFNIPEGVGAEPSPDEKRAADFLHWQGQHSDLDARKAGDVLRIAAATGRDPDDVLANYDGVAGLRRQFETDRTDWHALAKEHPAIARFGLSAQARAALVRDDSANLSGIAYALTGKLSTTEEVVGDEKTGFATVSTPRWTPPFWGAVLRDAINASEASWIRTKQWARNIVTKEPAGTVPMPPADAARLAELEHQVPHAREYGIDEIRSPPARTLAHAFAWTAETVPLIGGTIAASAAGGVVGGPGGAVVGGLTFNFVNGVGDTYEATRNAVKEAGKEGDPDAEERALFYATLGGLANARIMTAGGGPLAKGLAAKIGLAKAMQGGEAGVAKVLADETVARVVARAGAHLGEHYVEGLATMAAMSGVSAGVAEATRSGSIGEPFQGERVGEAIATATKDAALGMALMSALSFPVREFTTELGRAARLERSQRQLARAIEAARASRTVEGAPGEAEALINEVAKGSDGDVFFVEKAEFDRLLQEQKDDQGNPLDPRTIAADVIGDGGKAWDEASATGADLAIPSGAYLSKLSRKPFGLELRDITRLAQDARTPRQQREVARLVGRKIKAQADAATARGEQTPHDAIFEDFRDKAIAAGRSKVEAETNAEVVARSCTWMGAESGMDPVELYRNELPTSIHGGGDTAWQKALDAALEEYDAKPEARAAAFLREGRTSKGLGPLADRLRREALAAGKGEVPAEIKEPLAAVTKEIGKLEAKRAREAARAWARENTTGTRDVRKAAVRAGQEAAEAARDPARAPSTLKTAHVVAHGGELAGVLDPWQAGQEVPKGSKLRPVTLPSWLPAESFVDQPKAWEWTWAAFRDGQKAPEQAQRLVFGYMREALSGDAKSDFGLRQGYAVARLLDGKGGRKFDRLREDLEEWMRKPEGERSSDPVQEAFGGRDPWGVLVDFAQRDVEWVARGDFVNKRKHDTLEAWLKRTSAELDESRPTYDSRPPLWYGQEVSPEDAAKAPASVEDARRAVAEARKAADAAAAQSNRPSEDPDVAAARIALVKAENALAAAETAAGEADPIEARLAQLRAEKAALEEKGRAAAEASLKVKPRLDADAVTKIAGDDPALRRYVEAGGVHPDELARVLGMKSGVDLVKALRELPEREKWAKARAREGIAAQPREELARAAQRQGAVEQARRPSFEEIRARIEAQDQRAKDLVAAGERPLRFPDRNPSMGTYLIHRDTHPGREGKWRITRFGVDGEPNGHTNAETFAAAIKEARFQGADLLAASSRFDQAGGGGHRAFWETLRDDARSRMQALEEEHPNDVASFPEYRTARDDFARAERALATGTLADRLEQPAWHGTPYRGIDRFSTEKIGTGEGAQAYGWGLYFAEDRQVAEEYRRKLSRDLVFLDGKLPEHEEDRAFAGALARVGLGNPLSFAAAKRKVREAFERELEGKREVLAAYEEGLADDHGATRAAREANVEAARRSVAAAEERIARLDKLKHAALADSFARSHEDTVQALRERAAARIAEINASPEWQAGERHADAYDAWMRRDNRDLSDPGARDAYDEMMRLEAALPSDAEMERLHATVRRLEKIAKLSTSPTHDAMVSDAYAPGPFEVAHALGARQGESTGAAVRRFGADTGVQVDDLVTAPAGQTYKVEVPENDRLLSWDEPMSAQPHVLDKIPQDVRDELEEMLDHHGYSGDLSAFSGREFYTLLKKDFAADGLVADAVPGATRSDEAASKYLHTLGIDGLRYLDGMSRRHGEGSHNFVVWNEDAVKILDTLYQRKVREALDADAADPRAPVEAALEAARQRVEDAADAERHAADAFWRERADEPGPHNTKDDPAYAKASAEKRAAEKEIARLTKELDRLGGPRNLLVQHNLTAENLVHADELGGLAVPSIGVARKEHPLEGFGDITLLAAPSLIDPANGVPVFNGDAYSPRFPSVRWKVNEGAARKLGAWLRPFGDLLKSYTGDVGDALERGPGELLGDRRWRAPLFMAWLEGEHGERIPRMSKRAAVEGIIEDAPALQRFAAEHPAEKMPDIGGEYHRALSAAMREGLKEYEAKLRAEGLDAEDVAGIVEKVRDRWLNEEGLLNAGAFDKLRRELERFGKEEPDAYGMEQAVEDRYRAATPEEKAAFEKWAQEKMAPALGDRRIMVKTREGNFRPRAYTLDNIVGAMTRKIAGGEDFISLGWVRSHATKKFRDLDAIKAARDKVISPEDFKAVREGLDKEFGDLATAVEPFYNGDRFGFGGLDSLAEALAGSFKRGHYLSRELALSGFKDVPPEVVQRLAGFAEKLRHVPTEYFEAKPQRAVGLDEFKAAVVPHDASARAREILKKHGLDVIEYQRGDEESRRDAIARAATEQNLLFQREVPLEEGAVVNVRPGKRSGPRGYFQIEFNLGGEAVKGEIHLENPDRSTLAHESMHWLAEVMGKVVEKPDASPVLRESYQTLLRAMGYADARERRVSNAERRALAQEIEAREQAGESVAPADRARLKALTAKEERVTHLWEQFLLEGKAPTKDLIPVFARFKTWLTRIYKGIEGIRDQFRQTFGEDLALTDDVRQVFQRMLAGDEAVRDATAQLEAEHPPVNLTPAEKAEADRLKEVARAEAEVEMQRLLADEERSADKEFMRAERERFTAEVEGELAQDRTYAAIDALSKGDVGGVAVKIDATSVAEAYGKDAVAAMPKDVFAEGKGGVDPDAAAALLGFPSGERLVRAIMGAEPKKKVVARQVAERMRDAYPSLKDRPALLAEIAKGAVQSAAWLRDGVLRLRAMAREAGVPLDIDEQAIMDGAERMVRETRYSDLRPGRFDRAAVGAARRAAEAKDPAQRMSEFETYLLNRALYKKATEARAEQEKLARATQRFTTPRERAKLGKVIETAPDGTQSQPLLDQVDALLASYELRAGVSMKEVARRPLDAAAHKAWVDERFAQGDTIITPPSVLETLGRVKHWKDLTLPEMQDLHDAVASIAAQADLHTKMTVGGKKVETENAIRELLTAARTNGAQLRFRLAGSTETRGERARDIGRQAKRLVERPEELFLWLDGGTPGPWTRYVWRPLSDASYRFHDLVRTQAKPVVDFLAKLPKEERQRLRGTRFEVDGHEYDGEALVTILANLGNESNESKLVRGMSDPSLPKDFNTEPWYGAGTLDRIIAHATQADVDIVNALHKMLESTWPESEALEMRVSGVKPKKVAVRPRTFKGKDGQLLTIEGGYYPVIYSHLYRVGKTQAEAEARYMNGLGDLFSSSYERAMTPTSHLQERVEAFAKPFDLTLDALPRKLTASAKDIAFRETALQTYRVLTDQRIAGALTQALGEKGYKTVVAHLQETVNDVMLPDNGSDLALRIVRRMRSMAAKAPFLLDVPQTMQNFADVVGVHEVVPPRFFADSALAVLRDWRAEWAKLEAESAEMRIRREPHGGIGKAMEETFRKSGIAMKWEEASDLMMLPFETTNAIMEGSVYRAAREHAFAAADEGGLGLPYEEAVRHGEDAVRKLFGGKRTVDLSPIQRHKIMRHFVMFYGWANAQLGLAMTAAAKAGRAWTDGERSRALKILGAAFATAAAKQILSELLVGHAPKDSDEDGKLGAADVAKWAALQAVIAVPSKLPFAGAIGRAIDGGPASRDVSLTPWVAALNAGVAATKKSMSTASDVEEGTATGDEELDAFLAAIEFGGTVSGMPARQATRAIRYWRDRPPASSIPERIGQDVLGTAYGPQRDGKVGAALFGAK